MSRINKCFILFIQYLLVIVIGESPENNLPQVETPLGKVNGLWKETVNGRKFASYEGIPFAEPPVGPLRFQEPIPATPWKGVWNAQRAYKCPQSSFSLKDEISGTEDCLYINVYVPETTSKNLDVVVHIHGGAFMVGYAMEFLDAKYVMDRDLILVAANYRLGVLGFLSTGDEIVPGNNGLKDQVLALKWVQKNIASFGGNPDSVTLTGFSAGAGSAHLHYFSPLSRGLFHRGISLSGSALDSWVVKENPMKNTRKLAELVGCNDSVTKDLVDCLKNRPAYLLLDNVRKHLYGFPPAPFCLFTPVVEKHSQNAFLTEDADKLLAKGEVLNVPWITSAMAQDGLVGSLPFTDKLYEVVSKWSEVIPYVTESEDIFPESRRSEIADKIKEFYSLSETLPHDELFQKLTQFWTDRLFSTGAELSLQLQAKVSKAPVYYYVLDYEGENSLKTIFGGQNVKGTCHGDDMIYFFGGIIINPLSERDIKLQNICLDMLYNYAHTGVPTINGTKLEPVGEKLVYYEIKGPDDIQLKTKTDYTTNKFWSNIELDIRNAVPKRDEF